MATPVYPATNNAEAIELNISNANQFFTILQGGIDDFIVTYEGNGEIPSVAKALHEAAAYRTPLPWQTSGEETDLLQPRLFDGDIYVPLSVPAPFNTTPDNAYWRMYSTRNAGVTVDNQTFTGDGTTTDFSIPSMVTDDPAAYLVSIDGIMQRPTIDYTIDVGTDTLSFVEAPPATAADNITVTILGALRGAIAEEIYANVAEGLAATSDGNFFHVVNEGDPEVYVDLYRNDSGSGTLIASYPSAVAYGNFVNEVMATINSLDATQVSYDNASSGLTATNVQAAIDEVVAVGGAALRQELASTTPGQGASLVSMENGESVEEAVNKRTVFVGSVAELEATESSLDGQEAMVQGVPFRFESGTWKPSRGYVTPHCFTGLDGGEKIQAALDYAEAASGNIVVVTDSSGPDAGNVWSISKTVLIPNNSFMVFSNSYVKLADDANVSMFRTKNSLDLSAGQNIHLLGLGRAVFDGNNLQQSTLPATSTDKERIGLHFFNITNFSVKNIVIRETHGWGISFENGCNAGDIGPIRFEQQDTTTNQDGVNLRQGCWDIVIHDITGTTGDDTVALTAIGHTPVNEGDDGMQVTYDNVAGIDIYNITIKNVTSKVLGGNHTVRLLNSDGRELHDITIDEVNDITLPSDITTGAKAINAVITINGGTYFDATEVQEDEMRNIEIRNVSGNANTILLFGNQCGRITVNGVTGRGYCKGLLKFDKSASGSPLMKEISIRGLSLHPFVDDADFDWNNMGTVIYVGKARLVNVDFEEIQVLMCTHFFQSTVGASLINCKIRQGRVTKTGFEPFVIDSGTTFQNCILQDFEVAARNNIGSGPGASPGRFYGTTFRFILKGDCPDITSADYTPNPYKSSRVIFAAGTGGFEEATYAMGDGANWVPIVTLPNY